MELIFDVELSEQELLSIGKIIVLWGSLEYEIFRQTLMSFDTGDETITLPKEMNNMQFAQVLALWETRVVNKVKGTRRNTVLQKQLTAIRHYYDYRNALAHGMWDWSTAAPERITTTRIRKKDIISTHFRADDLASFVFELQRINFKVRYPGGGTDYGKAMAKKGSYISRLGLCLMTSNPLTDELLPSSIRDALATYRAQNPKG